MKNKKIILVIVMLLLLTGCTTYLKDEIYSWEDEGLEKRKSKTWKKTMKELLSQTTEQ